MRKLLKGTTAVLVAGVALGSLALGGTAVAGATTPPAHARPHTGAHHGHKHHHFALATFKCTHADRALIRIEEAQSHIAAGLPKLTAREGVARAKGHTVRADRIKKRISRRESAKFKAWLAKAATGIEGKCHVSAPPVPASHPTQGSTQA